MRARTNKPRQRFFQRVRHGSGCPEGEIKLEDGEQDLEWDVFADKTYICAICLFLMVMYIVQQQTIINQNCTTKNNLIAIIHQSFTRNRGNGHD